MSIFTFYPYKVHIHRIINANTRKRDFEKHAKTCKFHSSLRASELAAPPGSRRSTNYQLRMALVSVEILVVDLVSATSVVLF